MIQIKTQILLRAYLAYKRRSKTVFSKAKPTLLKAIRITREQITIRCPFHSNKERWLFVRFLSIRIRRWQDQTTMKSECPGRSSRWRVYRRIGRTHIPDLVRKHVRIFTRVSSTTTSSFQSQLLVLDSVM